MEGQIQNLIQNPTEENKEQFLKELNKAEYKLLVDAEDFPFKSQEYFNKRAEAFALRGKVAAKLLQAWVSVYGSTEGCPLKYADTLNIPFRSIGVPDDEVF